MEIPSKIQLVITLTTENGKQSVNASGPLADRLLCYGMLEMARDAIRDYKVPTIALVPQVDPIVEKLNGR